MSNALVGKWSYRSLLNNPDLSISFNNLRFGQGTIDMVIDENGRISGTIGGPGWSLNLSGVASEGDPSVARFEGRGDIGGEEWAVLLMLWQRDGLLPSEIAEATTRDRTTTTRMLDRLVKKGLVLRGSDKADGRRVVVSLTERGRGLREVLVPAAGQFVAEATKGLEQGDIDQALKVLKVISANIADMDG